MVTMAPIIGPGDYDTRLSRGDELAFSRWLGQHPKGRGDLQDYDVRGAWKAHAIPASGHGPDTWKKPNHPSFSDESIYSVPGHQGGHWTPPLVNPEGQTGWSFTASPDDLVYRDANALRSYFDTVEPGNRLVLPPNALR
jgi:hypothetical protein